jgi:hypothetical protein
MLIKKKKARHGGTGNSSYSGGRDQEGGGVRPVQANSS